MNTPAQDNPHTHVSEHPHAQDMSQSQQQNGQARQPGNYPSPTSYPSPGMSNTQYPFTQGQQSNEPYRASPTGSNSSLPLPSMRDSLQQGGHPQHLGQAHPPNNQPYYPHPQSLPQPPHMVYPGVSPEHMRAQYPLPPTDHRIIGSGGRNKKEIKRRTKTGCLTCRKRRIKCDEHHPACRNCQKSKRECLGYDPIFKGQQGGPAPIQPAPSASPGQTPANPYGDQPLLYPPHQPNMPNAYDPALSGPTGSGGPASGSFDYGPAIDPALEAAPGVATGNPSHYQQLIPGTVEFLAAQSSFHRLLDRYAENPDLLTAEARKDRVARDKEREEARQAAQDLRDAAVQDKKLPQGGGFKVPIGSPYRSGNTLQWNGNGLSVSRPPPQIGTGHQSADPAFNSVSSVDHRAIAESHGQRESCGPSYENRSDAKLRGPRDSFLSPSEARPNAALVGPGESTVSSYGGLPDAQMRRLSVSVEPDRLDYSNVHKDGTGDPMGGDTDDPANIRYPPPQCPNDLPRNPFLFFKDPFAGSCTYKAAGKIKIEDLLAQANAPPTITPEITSKLQDSVVLEEVKHLYHSIYAQGLESFLESKWFPSKGGSKLLSDTKTLEQFLVLLEQFKKAQDNQDSSAMSMTSGVEARAVWALACMVRLAAADGANGASRPEHGFLSGDDASEAANRLAVFENLITGAVAPNVLSRQQPNSDPHRIRELEFWFQLGHFVSLYDNGSQQFAIDVDATMTALRGLLDGRENRDVLYSIVVVRALGPRVAEYTESDKPLHLDESDARSKLAVAKKFVKDEGSGAGTTNVIRRLCELATRSWETTLSPPPTVA